MLYFDKKHAIEVHDSIIEKSGGFHGLLLDGNGKLDSLLEHLQNDDYYPTLEAKVTHLVFSLNKQHAFIDGNKRSSIALGSYFLIINGHFECIGVFILEMENISVWVADNVINKTLLGKIIQDIITSFEISEDVKLEIFKEISTVKKD